MEAGWKRRLPDLCEFKTSLVYRVSSRTTRTVWRNLVLKNNNKQTNKQIKEVGPWEKIPEVVLCMHLYTSKHTHML